MSHVISTANDIALFRLASIRAQLRLESVGMKSSGGALRPRLAVEFGLKPRASHAKYLEVIDRKINLLAVKSEKQEKQHHDL